jgi:hypothetical protein
LSPPWRLVENASMNRRVIVGWVALASSVAACGPERGNGFDVIIGSDDVASSRDASDVAPPDEASAVDAGMEIDVVDVPVEDTGNPIDDAGPSDVVVPTSVFVYAHSPTELFQVNPRTFEVRSIGLFTFPSDGRMHQMTDIAITADNQIWGVTFDALYRIDASNAACTYVTNLASGLLFNGLSFLPGTSGGPERLVATTLEGEVYEIDRSSGAAMHLGSYGGGYGSSGDLVFVYGAGTFATVVDGNLFSPTEYLARIDETTGAATIIGPTGSTHTWGIGYWGGTLYGFTDGGQFVTIDTMTGRATTVSSSAVEWWGAGVSTRAPITHS